MFGIFKPKGTAAVDKAVELYRAGHKPEALEMALRGAQTGAPAGWGVAAGLYLEMGKYQDCLAAAETAIGSDLPDVNKAAAWNAKGQALASLGKLAEARLCYPHTLVALPQALNLATVLTWKGAADAPPASPTRLGNTHIRAWFPAEPDLREQDGMLQYGLVTPRFTYLIVRETPLPSTADPQESLMHFMQERLDTRTYELVKLELKPPYLSYGAFDGQRLQVGRMWLSGVYARVMILEVRDGAAIEPGRFLGSVQIGM